MIESTVETEHVVELERQLKIVDVRDGPRASIAFPFDLSSDWCVLFFTSCSLMESLRQLSGVAATGARPGRNVIDDSCALSPALSWTTA